MSAKEMFERLGYETSPFWQKDHTISYTKYEDDDFYGKIPEISITFHKRAKKIKLVGILTTKGLQAINKQVEELGWLESDEEWQQLI